MSLKIDHELVRFVLLVVCSVAAGAWAACVLSSCAPRKPYDCAWKFRQEMLACVKHNTRDEYEACREGVEIRWGYPHD